MVVPTSTNRAAVRGMARGSTKWAMVSAEKNDDSIPGNSLPGKEQADCSFETKQEPGDQPGYEAASITNGW